MCHVTPPLSRAAEARQRIRVMRMAYERGRVSSDYI